MCHPASKTVNFPSVLVTALCATICQQEVTNRTRGHCVALCSPGQECPYLTTTAGSLIEEAGWRWWDDTSQPRVLRSCLFWFIFQDAFSPCFCVQESFPHSLERSHCYYISKAARNIRKVGGWWWWGKGFGLRVMLPVVGSDHACFLECVAIYISFETANTVVLKENVQFILGRYFISFPHNICWSFFKAALKHWMKISTVNNTPEGKRL